MKLRPYQKEAVSAVVDCWHYQGWLSFWKRRARIGIVLPTGAGKTLIATSVLVQEMVAETMVKALFVVHTKRIAAQAVAELGKVFIVSQVGDGKKDTTGQVVVALIQSLGRLEKLPYFSHLIVDESHLHDNARFHKLLDRLARPPFGGQPPLLILGLSATPKLGQKPRWMDRIVYWAKREPLTKAGWLAKAIVKTRTCHGPSDVLSWWQREAGNRKTIAFVRSVWQARVWTAVFAEAGIKADFVDGQTRQEDREWIEKHAHVLFNVGVYREGADLPGIGCVLLIDASSSPQRYIQQVGRGLRPDTENCIVLAANTKTHSLDV